MFMQVRRHFRTQHRVLEKVLGAAAPDPLRRHDADSGWLGNILPRDGWKQVARDCAGGSGGSGQKSPAEAVVP